MNSKQKGKRGELELASRLRDLGFSEIRRSVQYNGKAKDAPADLIGVPGYHVEVKRVEKLNINTAMEQAMRDHAEGTVPAVFHRKNRSGWLVTIPLEEWVDLYRVKYDDKQ